MVYTWSLVGSLRPLTRQNLKSNYDIKVIWYKALIRFLRDFAFALESRILLKDTSLLDEPICRAYSQYFLKILIHRNVIRLNAIIVIPVDKCVATMSGESPVVTVRYPIMI
jgi:hypothetical protein